MLTEQDWRLKADQRSQEEHEQCRQDQQNHLCDPLQNENAGPGRARLWFKQVIAEHETNTGPLVTVLFCICG